MSFPLTVTDATAVVTWLALLWLAALAAFLLTRPALAAWPDQGYGISKVLGPLLLGVTWWMCAGVLGLSGTRLTALGALCLLALAAASVAWRFRSQAFPSVRLLLRVDLLVGAAVVVFGGIRTWSPSISGAEQFMDHALLAAMMGQGVVPPVDPWLAGHPVNYHVGGYAWWAPVGLLAAQPPWVTYNLVLATLPAQAFAAAVSLGARMRTGWTAWAGGAMLVSAGGWAPLVAALRDGRVGLGTSGTRVIPDTINEFPLFSVTWGDLHAHVLALPLLVAGAALVVALDERLRDAPRSPGVLALTTLVAAVAAACLLTSSWDVLPVTLGAAWVALMLAHRAPRRLVPAALLAGATALIIAWPTLATFRPPAVPVGWEWQGSPLLPFLLVVGAWLSPLVLLSTARLPWLALLTATLVLAAQWSAPWMAVRVLLVGLGIGIWRQRSDLGRAATGCALSALVLLVVADSVWVDDIYGWQLRRLNTVFKWHLHAMVLLSLAMPAVLHALWTPDRGARRWALRGAVVGLSIVTLLSTAVVIAARYLEREPVRSLDGLSGMARNHPGDAAAVRYLWRHAAGGDVVLEAVGASYTYGSRISAMTGHPTLLGWEGHERLWRRGAGWDAVIAERRQVVDRLYAGPAHEVRARLAAHEVRYIVVGPVERRRYPGLQAERFGSVADVVLSVGDTEVLRVR